MGVTKTYGEGSQCVTALAGIDLLVEPGEFIAITGPSGCGKSTLLHLACGLDMPSTGEVVFDGRSTKSRSDDDLTLMRRTQIGLIFQSFNLIPTLTALENVILPRLSTGTASGPNRMKPRESCTASAWRSGKTTILTNCRAEKPNGSQSLGRSS
jgi:putative ABC transport system ATP-binding protein